ncbi:MAG: thiamine diphosphokinase [Bacteroidales bacterium]|nr:thiamine diphosphokinase [Bacteroidales bacterium]
MKTVILANGEFPKHPIPLKILNEAEQVICCDGATLKLLNYMREPNLIIGDLDSLPEEIKSKYAGRLICITEQENNDLTKAVNWCFENNIKEITILGATGLRTDHTIGNIALLARYGKKIVVQMVDDYGIYTPISQTTTFSSFTGQQVSIFSIQPETAITLEGLKYPLNKQYLTEWWMGTLNESSGDSFSIISEKGSIVVFQTHKSCEGPSR